MRAVIAAVCGILATFTVVLAQQRSFVSCPIVRDTRTVPCFLAEYEGEIYFLGIQQDVTSQFHPPQLKHQVLVEGTVAPGPRVCGGIRLDPVAISVMKEISPECDTLLPAETGLDAPPARRGAGPSSEPPSPPIRVPLPSGGFLFTVSYPFNDDFLDYQAQQVVEQAATYAKQIRASSVKVEGYRAASLLSNGQELTEKAGLAEKRAQGVAVVLRGLGVANVIAEGKADPETANGKSDPSLRRVGILVNP